MAVNDSLLLPVPDEDGAPFWEYAARGELRVQACASPACGELRFPPRPCCPHCGSFESDWQEMSGRGRLWSYVVPHPPLLPAYAEQAPYNAVLVELAEAPHIRLAGNVVASPDAPLNSVDPARLRIGAPVRAAFCPAGPGGGVTLVRWLLER
ncbi:Zn-ribbon domain-containing OB-fold protein [Streptomyces anulatus]|uniref:Zn-ribbon domain-containing OB-fold protein n=1 Tax=Streptomyces anulatus TaxID=1892 RepID=UPI003866A7E2|nr:OB-fold domain-containing protein [Streptomyces anulatus]WSU90261.1 OB-fold domain-containing protein [Streptomyces anulatus]